MEKEDRHRPKIIQSSETFIKNITQKNKIKKRERLRKEFLQEQKERYKNEKHFNKKEIIAQLKEVYKDAS